MHAIIASSYVPSNALKFFVYLLIEIDFNKFGAVLNKQMQATGATKVFKPGLEMDGNTYGGMSLKQIKDVIDSAEASSGESFKSPSVIKTPIAGVLPVKQQPGPSVKQKPTRDKPLPPQPKKSPSPGYVNLVPSKTPSSSSGHTRTPSAEEEEFDDEDDQEVYIAPGEFADEEEQPIYENHGPTPSSKQQQSSAYANVSYNNAPAPSLYQNVTYDGKPHTPPRQVRPSPSPNRPRRK